MLAPQHSCRGKIEGSGMLINKNKLKKHNKTNGAPAIPFLNCILVQLNGKKLPPTVGSLAVRLTYFQGSTGGAFVWFLRKLLLMVKKLMQIANDYSWPP